MFTYNKIQLLRDIEKKNKFCTADSCDMTKCVKNICRKRIQTKAKYLKRTHVLMYTKINSGIHQTICVPTTNVALAYPNRIVYWCF